MDPRRDAAQQLDDPVVVALDIHRERGDAMAGRTICKCSDEPPPQTLLLPPVGDHDRQVGLGLALRPGVLRDADDLAVLHGGDRDPVPPVHPQDGGHELLRSGDGAEEPAVDRLVGEAAEQPGDGCSVRRLERHQPWTVCVCGFDLDQNST